MAFADRRGWQVGLLIAAAACVTTDSRSPRDQALFESFPPSVQQNIRQGTIEVGYTPEMVRMALGEPDRRTQVETEDGLLEVWTWRTSRPGIGIGIGTGRSIGSHVGVGTQVSVGKPPTTQERAVVEFRDGRVVRFRATTPE